VPLDVHLFDVLSILGDGFPEVFDFDLQVADVFVVSGVLQVDDVVLSLDELLFVLFDCILKDYDRFLQLIYFYFIGLDGGCVIVDNGKFSNLGL
jgi:hypothetical protein